MLINNMVITNICTLQICCCHGWLFLYSQAFCSWHRTTDPSSEDYQASLQIWSAFNCQEGVGRCQKTCRKETSGKEQSGGCRRTSVKSCSSIFSHIRAFAVCSPYLKNPFLATKLLCFVTLKWISMWVPFVCIFASWCVGFTLNRSVICCPGSSPSSPTQTSESSGGREGKTRGTAESPAWLECSVGSPPIRSTKAISFQHLKFSPHS